MAPAAVVRPRPIALPHLPALDGLRGLAVGGVLLFHAGHLKGGFLGVDLFFTLSGFLITSLLLTEHARTGRIALGAFWSRRARRLLPAVLALFLAVAGYTTIWGHPSDYPGVRNDGLAALFYVANWRSIFAGNGYWDDFNPKSPFDHLWSLAIEEQFYVLWPLIVAFVLWRWRGRLMPLTIITAGATAASALAMIVLHEAGEDPNRVYLGTDTRVASILVGALLSLACARFPLALSKQRPANDVIGVGALMLLLVSWVFIDGTAAEWLYEGGLLAHAVVTAIVIAVAFGRRSGPLAKLLGLRPLRWMGRVSYGLYLWHWPVYWAMNPFRMGFSGWRLTILRLVVSAVIAEASFRLLESPIRRGALKPAVARLALPVAVAACVGALLGSTIPPAAPTIADVAPATTAVPTTIPPGPIGTPTTLAPTVDVGPTPDPTPPTTLPAPVAAALGDELVLTSPADPSSVLATLRRPTPANPLRVLMLGDSFMFDAAPGIVQALTATGVVTATDASVPGFTLTNPSWEATWTTAVSATNPELVLMLFGSADTKSFTSKPEQYVATFNQAMAVALGPTAKAIVIGLPPSIAGGGVNLTVTDRSINRLFAEQVTNVAGRVVYLDSEPIVAPSGRATLTIDGPEGPLRVRKVDLHHFCPDGSARYARAILALLTAIDIPTPPDAAWLVQIWRLSERYNDPAGVCS